ncbi:MAG: hypothetical protein JKY94_17025, partial [Rhodobacteraceae bacterium]|nr:hypothetical protein [Paracoccaceae bacterium]
MLFKERLFGLRSCLLAAIFCVAPVFSPMFALAVETNLTVKDASEDVVDRLTAASLSVSAQDQGLTSAQELLAAALSDYSTLVQVLYDQGYFSPVIHIRVNGREAAEIPPLHPPSTVKRIEISVTTGPKFSFGQAVVKPLATDTELPEGFRSGAPATTGLIGDAARAGVSGWQRQGHALADVSGQRIRANHQAAVLDAEIRL